MGAILGAIFSGIWSALAGFVTGILQRKEDEKVGAEAQALADEKPVLEQTQAAAKTEAAVAQAEADAPKTQAEVVDSLDKGTF